MSSLLVDLGHNGWFLFVAFVTAELSPHLALCLWSQLWSLPRTCQHLWLDNCLSPNEVDGLPNLRTLVLRLHSPSQGDDHPPVYQTVLSTLGNMTTLETLGLTLPADSDLSPLTNLVKVHTLVLNYNDLTDR